MKCDNCHENPARVFVTKVVDNQAMQFNLCETCAEMVKEAEPVMVGLSLKTLLEHVLEVLNANAQTEKPQTSYPDLQCDLCGLTFTEFAERKLLGCERCYERLGEGLQPLLRETHGAEQHVGKVPKRLESHMALRQQIADLEGELRRVVEREHYEEAAQIRDTLRALRELADLSSKNL